MRSPDILSLRRRAPWRRAVAEASIVALCAAITTPGLDARQQAPPTVPAPEVTRAPAVAPATPTATLRLDPLGDQVPDSIALGQPFHLRLTVPADWQPGQTVTVTVSNGGHQDTLLLTQIDATNGLLTFSSPGPVTIGGVLGGASDPSSRFAITTEGTVMLSQPPGGSPMTITLTGFRGPDTNLSLSVPLFDNPVEQNIWRIERALTVLEAITKRQQADAAWILSQPDVPADVRGEAQAFANTADRNAIVLAQARSSMAGAGTRLGTLIAGSEYLALVVRGPGNLEWGTALENVQRRIVESAGREAIIRDNVVSYATATTYSLYELTRVLTLAGPAYEAGQLVINPALRRLGHDVGSAQGSWGQAITTEEQIFALVELTLAIGLMAGLPRLVDWLAGRTLRSSMRQQPPPPRSEQFARAPGGNSTATQPLPRTGPGTTTGTRTGPGDTPIAPAPAEAATSPTLRGGEPAGGGGNRAPATEASESPTLRGGDATIRGNNRAPTASSPAPAVAAGTRTRATAMQELQQVVLRARKQGVSDEVIDLIWQNSTSLREAVMRIRGATTLRKGDVANDVIAEALRTSHSPAEIDEIFLALKDASDHTVLNATLREIFANAGSREQLLYDIRRQIGRAAIDGLKVEVARTGSVEQALARAEKVAKAAGIDMATIGGTNAGDRLDNILRAILVRRGYVVDVEAASPEVLRIQQIFTRTFVQDPLRPNSGNGRLSDEDLIWLHDRRAEDPFYFNNLPTRGRVHDGEFIPILDARSAVRLRSAYRDATGGDSFGDYDPIGSLDSLSPPAGGRPAEAPSGSASTGSSTPAPGTPAVSPRQAADWRALIESAPTNVGPSPATAPTPVPVPSTGATTSPGGEATTTGTGSGTSQLGTPGGPASDRWTPIRERAEANLAHLRAERVRLQAAIEDEDGSTRDQHRRELRQVDEDIKHAGSWVSLIRWQQQQDEGRAANAPTTGAAPATETPPGAAPSNPPAAPAEPAGPNAVSVAPDSTKNDLKATHDSPSYARYGWRRSADQTLTLRVGARVDPGNDTRRARLDMKQDEAGALAFLIGGGLLPPEEAEKYLRDNPGVRNALQTFLNTLQAAAINAADHDDAPQDQSTLTWTDDQPIVVAANDSRTPSAPWALGGLWAMLREALGSTRIRGPYAMRHLRARESWIAPAYHAHQPAGAQPQAERPSVKLFFTSLGRSSGESVRMTVVNDGNVPVRIALGAVALEPLGKLTERDVQRELKRLDGRRNQVTVNLEAYCLNFRKPPPAAGTVMRLADPGRQARVAPLARIGEAARRLYERGALNREGDPKRYVENLLQWVIWTQEQTFDEQGFRRAFVDHARKNIAGAGRKWTRELEQAVTALTPQRWTDIQAILREAGTLGR